jgi:Kef-type K+ transport system membrane component KefB
MSRNANLAVLLVVVIIALALGVYAAILLASLGGGAVGDFGNGLGSAFLIFACPTATIALGYWLTTKIDRRVRDRQRVSKEQERKTRAPKAKRRRKK